MQGMEMQEKGRYRTGRRDEERREREGERERRRERKDVRKKEYVEAR